MEDDDKFWLWLLEEGSKIKLPMRGAPTVEAYLIRKRREYKGSRR